MTMRQARETRDPEETGSRRLERPKSINEVADLINKILFALGTLVVSFAGLTLNTSVDKANRRNELYKFLADAPPAASNPDQINKIAFLTKVCESYLPRIQDTAATYLCAHLQKPNADTIQKVNAQTAQATQKLESGGKAAATSYLASSQASLQNNLVAATDSNPLASSQDRWFAVIATVPATQPEAARSLATNLAALLPADVVGNRTVQVFRTRISDSFAITVGGVMGRDDATKLAADLRQKENFDDAFAQADRGWQPASP